MVLTSKRYYDVNAGGGVTDCRHAVAEICNKYNPIFHVSLDIM